jgi:hypothetical protein
MLFKSPAVVAFKINFHGFLAPPPQKKKSYFPKFLKLSKIPSI